MTTSPTTQQSQPEMTAEDYKQMYEAYRATYPLPPVWKLTDQQSSQQHFAVAYEKREKDDDTELTLRTLKAGFVAFPAIFTSPMVQVENSLGPPLTPDEARQVRDEVFPAPFPGHQTWDDCYESRSESVTVQWYPESEPPTLVGRESVTCAADTPDLERQQAEQLEQQIQHDPAEEEREIASVPTL